MFFETPVLSRKSHGFAWTDMLAGMALAFFILSTIMPWFRNASVRSGVARAKGDLQRIGRALDHYALDFGACPPSVDLPSRTRIPQAIYGGPKFAPPLNSHRMALAPLTTPVAYLKGGAGFDAAFPARAWEICEAEGRANAPSYWYCNYMDFWRTSRGRRVAPGRRLGYAVMAFGPKSLGVEGLSAPYGDIAPTLPKVPFFKRPNMRNLYDPTNGLLSPGNMIQFGGDLWLEDGAPYYPQGFEIFEKERSE